MYMVPTSWPRSKILTPCDHNDGSYLRNYFDLGSYVYIPIKLILYSKASQSRFADYRHHFPNTSSGRAVIIHYSLAIFFH